MSNAFCTRTNYTSVQGDVKPARENNTFLFLSFAYFILFQLLYLPSHQFCSGNLGQRLVFPPCKAHCSASSKIKRLKAMRDSTVFIFQPWFQVMVESVLLSIDIKVYHVYSWWFNTSSKIFVKMGIFPNFSG